MVEVRRAKKFLIVALKVVTLGGGSYHEN